MIDALVLGPQPHKKGEPKGSPSQSVSQKLRSGLPSRRALNFPGVQTAGAHLHLRDLAVDYDARDLKIRLPGPPRPVVGVGDVVAEGDALVANETAISSDLCHRLTLRRDELDTSHLGAVTLAVAGFQDAGVTTLSRRETWPDFVEQLVGSRAVRDVTTGQAPVVQRACPGLGDDLLDERTQLLGFRLRRLDSAPLDQCFRQASHQGELLLAGAAKLFAFFTVTHPYTSSSSSAPTVATLRLGGVP